MDAFEPEIRRLVAEFPEVPATVIAERIGWKRGTTILKERVWELRPLFEPPDPCQRTHYEPGEFAQFDLCGSRMWRSRSGGARPTKLWVVPTVTGFSRFDAGWMVPTRAARDVLAGMLRCLEQIGALPRTAVWDGEGCIGQWRKGVEVLTEERQRFRVPWGSGPGSASPTTQRPRDRRAGPLPFRDELPARAQLRRRRRLQRPIHRVAEKANRRVHATTRGHARRGDL